ncbi:MAG: SDR family oxidoreductase [Actinobacteria bacterium]|nr:SDR family oxidoreductase [Actinomycetota bacterium]
MRLGITGGSGFIGWHLRCLLLERPDLEVTIANEGEFASVDSLIDFVRHCDAIIHLAGMNRGNEDVIYRTNVELAQALTDACRKASSCPRIVFANSIQSDLDNAYGRSKRDAWEVISRWSSESGSSCVNAVLPNVFGEHGRPFYNSVVATFCFQLANGQEPEIIEDRVVPLIHVREVVELLLNAALCGNAVELRPCGREIRVSELLAMIKDLDTNYRMAVIPDLSDSFVRDLFNTYRSFLFPTFYPVYPKMNKDDRGELFEAVVTRSGGQAFLSTTKPGITRGNHYHVKKFERFLVVKGKARIKVRRLLFEDVHEFVLDGEVPGYVDIPTLHTHNITNIGDGELITLFWADEIFDSRAPDTYAEQV